MKMKYIYIIMMTFLLTGMFTSCSKEELGNSIFVVTPPERSEFDKWLLDNYIKGYNIDFRYYLDDIESDMSYNLVPADFDKSVKLAKIVKYLWIEAYDEVFDATGVNKDFMRKYAPKMIQLVGSPAVNPTNGTIVLGTAEGGIKVVLYNVNAIDPTNVAMLNQYYFHTMHHEFAHILHQTKTIPVEFKTITPSDYSPTGWHNRSDAEAWKLGFVTPYASNEPQEDFVETISTYLVKSDAEWNAMLTQAGSAGAAKINRKFDLAKTWLRTSWNIEIDQLRAIIAKRSANINNILN